MIREICEAWANELTTSVSSLGSAKVHLYTARGVERLEPDRFRHVAIWPASEGQAESMEPLAIGAGTMPSLVRLELHLLLWEPSPEMDNQKADEDGWANFLDLIDEVRSRFLVHANQRIGGAMRTEWSSVDYPRSPSAVRWARIRFLVYVPVS